MQAYSAIASLAMQDQCRLLGFLGVCSRAEPYLKLLFPALQGSEGRGLEPLPLLFGSHVLYLLRCMPSILDMPRCLPAPL